MNIAKTIIGELPIVDSINPDWKCYLRKWSRQGNYEFGFDLASSHRAKFLKKTKSRDVEFKLKFAIDSRGNVAYIKTVISCKEVGSRETIIRLIDDIEKVLNLKRGEFNEKKEVA